MLIERMDSRDAILETEERLNVKLDYSRNNLYFFEKAVVLSEMVGLHVSEIYEIARYISDKEDKNIIVVLSEMFALHVCGNNNNPRFEDIRSEIKEKKWNDIPFEE